MRLRRFEDFAVAAKEYVNLLLMMRRVTAVTARLRQEQKALNDELFCELTDRDKREHVCPDLTTLRMKSTSRKEPLRKHHLVVGVMDIMSAQQAEKFWETLQEKRPVTETEALGFNAERAS